MRKNYTLTLFMSALLLSSSLCNAETPNVIDAPETDEVALGIYNTNLAFVKDARKVMLGKGENRISFVGVSAQIRPETAMLLNSNLKVIEQNYNYNLITPDNLLNASIGEKVKTALYNEQTGQTVYDSAEIIDASYGRPVLKFDYGIEANFSGRIIYEKIPDGLQSKPTFVVDVQNENAGEQKLELAYLTSGLNWKADYVAELRKDNLLSLNGLITLKNESGSDYENATVQLIAGSINQLNVVQPRMFARNLKMVDAAAAPMMAEGAAMPSQEALGDYYLYNLPIKTTLLDKQTKQVSLLEKKKVKYAKEYKLVSPLYLGIGVSNAEFLKANPQVIYKLQNTKADGLGEALPQGTVRFFEPDAKGNMQFIGESNLSQLALGEKADLMLGQSFDIFATGKTTASTRISDDISETSVEISFSNAKAESVKVLFEQNFNGLEWEVLSESIKSEKKNAATAAWMVEIPANGSETLRYKVRLKKQGR